MQGNIIVVGVVVVTTYTGVSVSMCGNFYWDWVLFNRRRLISRFWGGKLPRVRRTTGSDWNFTVQMSSYEPELSTSSIKDAWHRNAWNMASEVYFESWNLSHLGIADHFHSASQLANVRSNWGFWLFATAAFLSLLLW